MQSGQDKNAIHFEEAPTYISTRSTFDTPWLCWLHPTLTAKGMMCNIDMIISMETQKNCSEFIM